MHHTLHIWGYDQSLLFFVIQIKHTQFHIIFCHKVPILYNKFALAIVDICLDCGHFSTIGIPDYTITRIVYPTDGVYEIYITVGI